MRKPVAEEDEEMVAMAGPLAVKMLAFIRSDLPAPLQKHHDSPNTPIVLSLFLSLCFRSTLAPPLHLIFTRNHIERNGQHRKPHQLRGWMDRFGLGFFNFSIYSLF